MYCGFAKGRGQDSCHACSTSTHQLEAMADDLMIGRPTGQLKKLKDRGSEVCVMLCWYCSLAPISHISLQYDTVFMDMFHNLSHDEVIWRPRISVDDR
jgi:hypothetical protein